MDFNGVEPGFFNSGIGFGGMDYHALVESVREWEDALEKAYTTGEGVIRPSNITGTTDSTNLRVQYLRDALETASFEQDDARLMQLIPKPQAYSNTFEWAALKQYGGAGDGFVAEDGDDGSYNVTTSDEIFARLLRQIKYMRAAREIGLVSSLVKNVKDPETIAEKAATLELVGKANIASYWADSKNATSQFDGFVRQLLDWVSATAIGGYGNSDDQVILYDAGNEPIGNDVLLSVAESCRSKFGSPSLLLQSSLGYSDTQRLLFPAVRTDMGNGTGQFGLNKDTALTPYGKIKLEYDLLLRANRPLIPDGTGSNGKPRTAADSGAPTWNATPISGTTFASAADADDVTTGAGVAAGAAGAGPWWHNGTIGAYGNPTVVPAVPSGEGNQSNRLTAGVAYYYAVSAVYRGKESLPWVHGAASAGIITSATGTTPTAGQIISMTIDNAQVYISGSVATQTQHRDVKYRIYRCTGTPTSLASFDLLCEIGSSGTVDSTVAGSESVCWDNGMYIPGSQDAFLFTQKKNGVDAWGFFQLLPLMKRKGLPAKAMSDPLVLLLCAAPILLMPRHHIWIRNIGRAS